MIAVMVAGPGGDSLQGPEVLEHGALPLGGSPHGGQQAVAGLLVRGRAGVLRGSHHTDPRALIPFVRQDRHPQPGRPVQGRQHMQPRRGQVVGGAGLHRTGVDRESGDNPSPPARCRPAPRPRPEYHRWRPVSGLRRGHPVGADQGPIQTGERLSARATAGGPREGPGPGRRSRPGLECLAFFGLWFLVVSGCLFPAVQLVFGLVGGAVPQCRVESRMIIGQFDPRGNIFDGLFPCGVHHGRGRVRSPGVALKDSAQALSQHTPVLPTEGRIL